MLGSLAFQGLNRPLRSRARGAIVGAELEGRLGRIHLSCSH